jgi:uncharacterized protein (DUF2267 family)
MKDLYNRTLEVNMPDVHENSRKHHKPHALNFEAYAAEGNRFIREVAEALYTDRDTAARKCRAVLHALRDRLPPIDAVQFGQGLPMALKAVYFDRYDIAKAPLRIRNGRKFLDLIYEKDGRAAAMDFPDNYSVLEALRGVYSVLQRNMDEEQTGHIKHMLHYEIVRLIEGRPLRRIRPREYAW